MIEFVSDPRAPGTSVRHHGFSLKIRDARVTDLVAGALGPWADLTRNTVRACGLREAQAMGRPRREPLITFDSVRTLFALIVAESGLELKETEGWEPIIVQTRISRLENGKSTSPER